MGYAVGQRKVQGLEEQEKQEWWMKWDQEDVMEMGEEAVNTKQREGVWCQTERRKILELEREAHGSKGRCLDRKEVWVHSVAMAQLPEDKRWIHTPSLCKKCC